jgi:hypothetical protein
MKESSHGSSILRAVAVFFASEALISRKFPVKLPIAPSYKPETAYEKTVYQNLWLSNERV